MKQIYQTILAAGTTEKIQKIQTMDEVNNNFP
jgi:hypothetical protein